MISSSYQITASIPLAAVIAGVVVCGPASQGAGYVAPVSDQVSLGNLRSYVPRNSGMKIRIGPKATGDLVLDTYQPRTELGRKLMAIRRAYVFAGGELLTPDALEAEIRSRRGGVGNV
jgi:hypothetical protein